MELKLHIDKDGYKFAELVSPTLPKGSVSSLEPAHSTTEDSTGQWISSNVEASVALVSAIDAEGEKIIFTDTDFDEYTAVEAIRNRIEDIH